MMRSALVLLAVLLLLPTSEARADKAEVLTKIDELMAAGELDEAKRMIDFFLGKNPGDADLTARLDAWRIRKGDLAPLFGEKDLEKPENEAKLREVLLRIVRATYRGNPEEWDALPHAVSREVLRGLLVPVTEQGSAEEQRKAALLLDPEPKPFAPTVDQMIAGVKQGPEQRLHALRWAERIGAKPLLPYARKVFEGTEEPELKAAAAAVILRLGDDGPRSFLLEWLRKGTPPQALEALKTLVRHPGEGEAPIQGLLAAVEGSLVTGRVKPTLYALAVGALGSSGEPGARETLETLLRDPDHAVDAARALGAVGDRRAVPALLAFLRSPPEPEESAEGGGLGYLGGSGAQAAAAASEAVRPALVGALAILRTTRADEGK